MTGRPNRRSALDARTALCLHFGVVGPAPLTASVELPRNFETYERENAEADEEFW
jgi:hypothetical protein